MIIVDLYNLFRSHET